MIKIFKQSEEFSMKKEFRYLVIDNEDGPIEYYQHIFHLKLSLDGTPVFPCYSEESDGEVDIAYTND